MDEWMIEKRVDGGTKGSINRKCARRYVLLDLSTPTCLCLFLPTWIYLYTSWISAVLSHQDWYWQRYTFVNSSTSKHLQHGFVWNVGHARGGLQEGEIDKFQNHNEQIALLFLFAGCASNAAAQVAVGSQSCAGSEHQGLPQILKFAVILLYPAAFMNSRLDRFSSLSARWLSSGRNISVAMSSTQRPRSLRVYMIGGGKVAAHGMLANINNDAQVLLHAPSTYTLKILTPAHPPAHSF